MARKRGGLAGVWDRNKDVIKNVAPVALGMIPGAGRSLATVARAAMEGLDREGGRGFDLNRAMEGAALGYGQGSIGSKARDLLMGTRSVPVISQPTLSSGLTQQMGTGAFTPASIDPARLAEDYNPVARIGQQPAAVARPRRMGTTARAITPAAIVSAAQTIPVSTELMYQPIPGLPAGKVAMQYAYSRGPFGRSSGFGR